MARVHLISPFERSVTMLYDRSTGNRDESAQHGLTEAEDKTLATALLALADGIQPEFLIAPEEMSRDRAAVEALLQGAGQRAG
jgi:hypothetical protein